MGVAVAGACGCSRASHLGMAWLRPTEIELGKEQRWRSAGVGRRRPKVGFCLGTQIRGEKGGRVRDWGADPANEQGRAGGGGSAHGEKNVGN